MTANDGIKVGKSEKSLFIVFILDPIMRLYNLTKTQELFVSNKNKLDKLF